MSSNKKEVKKEEIIINAREVEGFNPVLFKKMNDTGDSYFLPLQVQIHWFWKSFPNGRLVVDEPKIDPEGTSGKMTAKAYIYSDMSDTNSLLSSASARKGINEDIEYMDAYDACQGSALSKALRFAGFSLPLTETDLFENQQLNIGDTNKEVDEKDSKTLDSNKEVEKEDSKVIDQKEEKPKSNRGRPKNKSKDKVSANDTIVEDAEVSQTNDENSKGEKAKEQNKEEPILEQEESPTELVINPDDKELMTAANYKCTHASLDGIPLIDLVNKMDSDPKVKRIISWIMNSPSAKEKHSEDIAQLTILFEKLNLLENKE